MLKFFLNKFEKLNIKFNKVLKFKEGKIILFYYEKNRKGNK